MIGFQHFRHFTAKIKEIQSLSSKMEHYEDSYNLRRYKISEISIQEAEKVYESIEMKFYKYYRRGESGSWFENELKVFVWALVCYVELYKRPIRQFNSQDWAVFEQIFYVKQPVLFQYQAKIILDYSLCLKKWSQQQDSMLGKIVSGVIKIKWSDIAKSLFVASDRQFLRTSKQCRERWLNHLDPSKSKDSWSLDQCRALLEIVKEKGKKWASLVQLLNGRRSEHSIKNKYNSMLIKQSKLTPSHTEQENIQALLAELATISAASLSDLKASQLFRDCTLTVKQIQSNMQEEHSLEKSNASLASTLNLNSKNENEISLNLDDFWLVNPENENKSQEFLVEKIPKKRRGKELNHKSIRQLQEMSLEYGIIDEEMESLVHLEDLKLVIRESELDR